jgi:ribosomal protein L24E
MIVIHDEPTYITCTQACNKAARYQRQPKAATLQSSIKIASQHVAELMCLPGHGKI